MTDVIKSPVCIFSLTPAGGVVAQKLLTILDHAEHLHNAKPFIATAQDRFSNGRRCIFICATGIVLRALAPVLKDKHSDPAVLVLDDSGKYVIPLLSGHEGGANAWGANIATMLNAQLVITSAADYTRPIYVVGMGCDRDCPEAMLYELYEKARSSLEDDVTFAALSSIDIKYNEAGLQSLARRLRLPFQYFDAQTLRSVEDRVSAKSDIVFKEVGCYSVAEAAALVAAEWITGNSAELVVTKQKNTRATIAIARSYY